jgi:predicted DCC family thiol-disulfide oxidoreductase YuxK
MPQDMIVLYDGVCGFCDRTVQFILKRDRPDRFRFATLQSDYARAILERHGRDPDEMNSVVLVEHPGEERERIHLRSQAVFRILRALGGIWRVVAMAGYLPAPLLDLGYGAVARVRYRVFGKFEECRIPSPEQKAKFLG